MEITMRAYERLLNYVKVYTTSDEDSTTVPSTARQFDLAKMLVEELHAIGVTNAEVDDKCYIYASIPATAGYEDLLPTWIQHQIFAVKTLIR